MCEKHRVLFRVKQLFPAFYFSYRKICVIFVIVKGLSLFFLGIFLLLSACSSPENHEVDKLNEFSYDYHYRNLDSTMVYAHRALRLAGSNDDAGSAEALNNMAFVNLVRMNYHQAAAQLDRILGHTDNQIELLIADIQYMRLCQRQSRNKDFYDYRESALRRFRRIEEEQEMLNLHQKKRMIYARTEFDIVTSTYYYYVGLEAPSIYAMKDIDENGEIKEDTAQLLNYYYNVGAGGVIDKGTHNEMIQTEFDYLMRCYLIAREGHYPFWEANAMQAMSEHLQSAEQRNLLFKQNLSAIKAINIDHVPDSLLAENLALRSLQIFVQFGDIYQIAGSWRTLAGAYWQLGNYRSALFCLNKALNSNRKIHQASDLIASIREQLSVVYAAIDDKPNSDYNRRLYLELQEMTRQDRQLEARADQLNRASAQLNIMILAVLAMIVITILLLFFFNYLRHHRNREDTLHPLLEPLEQWKKENEAHIHSLKSRYEEINEEKSIHQLHLRNNRQRNIEQRAKLSLVNSMTPFIDRMLNEVARLKKSDEKQAVREERYAYIAELSDKINDYNTVLTQWIQLRQGELSLHIESFRLQDIFDIVARGRMEFQLKGIRLCIKPTTAIVKADRILTLFMVNTIADNARKFTPSGGNVCISAQQQDNFVEICIHDTGIGMNEQQLLQLFTRQPLQLGDEAIDTHHQTPQKSHRFGLMNCKGIIDKYQKISKLFAVCKIEVESEAGKGTKVCFRLPKGTVRGLLVLIFATSSLLISAKVSSANIHRIKAAAFADSAYQSNLNGTYTRTLAFSDSCRTHLNRLYLKTYPHDTDTLLRFSTSPKVPAEIHWLHRRFRLNYQVVLRMRNESAVAALALHRWDLYRYNNKVYTQLFKEHSADTNLATYCSVMQKSGNNKTIAIVILVILFVLIFPAYYLLYYRHLLHFNFCIDKIKHINEILLSKVPESEMLRLINRTIQTDRTEKLPTALSAIIKQITSALQQSIDNTELRQQSIDGAKDELRRIQLEEERLYISNSVLDNCLSTLKHETMYYPSRISQLVEGRDESLLSLNELVRYYKDIFSLLSAQADRQVEVPLLQCRPVAISALTGKENEGKILCDDDMMHFLFEILKKQSGQKELLLQVSERGNRYVVFSIEMPFAMDETRCRRLFTPLTSNVQYLLCRQIIRETGEMTNARGCGILAIPAPNGNTTIEITLAKASKS